MIALGAKLWEKDIHNYFTMDEGKLGKIAHERAQESAAFAEKVNSKTYQDEIDQNFEEVFMHDIMLNVYVKDLALYENEYELALLKEKVFKNFIDPISKDVLLKRMTKMNHDADVCTHYAKGKSIYHKDGIMNLEQQGIFFT